MMHVTLPNVPEHAPKGAPSLLQASCAPIIRPPVIAPLAHATRDLVGQSIAKTIGLAIFTRAATLVEDTVPLSIVAGGISAISAATMTWLIASRQFGNGSRSARLGAIACTGMAGAAGAVIGGLGASQPVFSLIVGTTLTVTVSLLRLYARSAEEEHAIDDAKGIALFFGTAASLTAVAVTDHRWTSTSDVGARNLGILGESITVEFFKSTLERVGTSVDRNALNFNGKVLAGLAGLLPYLAMTVLINGYANGLLQPSATTDSHSFQELLLPVVLGALANAVRGAANATSVYLLHEHGIGKSLVSRNVLRPSDGMRPPEPEKILKKTAIRFFISSCRVAVYEKLRSRGMGIMQASILSQAAYGVFAQSRDLLFDLVQGEGWVRLQQDPAAEGNTPVDEV